MVRIVEVFLDVGDWTKARFSRRLMLMIRVLFQSSLWSEMGMMG